MTVKHSTLVVGCMMTCFIFWIETNVTAQKTAATPEGQLNVLRNDPGYEFSGLALYNGGVLLIPQNCRYRKDNYLYWIPEREIKIALANKKDFAVEENRKIVNYEFADALPGYDGFEAGVFVNNLLFLAVETDDLIDSAYIVRGVFDVKNYTIQPISYALPKPYRHAKNAGFESLTVTKNRAGKTSLIAFFECNRSKDTASAFLIDPSFSAPTVPLKFSEPLHFRLTDVTALNDTTFVGINRFFNGDNEWLSYRPGLSNKELMNYLGAASFSRCFNQLITFVLRDNLLVIKDRKYISDKCPDNWEGIVPYQNSVLLINDGQPGGKPTKLFAVPLNR